ARRSAGVPPQLRQLHGARAQEELATELGLKPPDSIAYGGLPHAAFFGRSPEAPLLCNGKTVANLLQVHCASSLTPRRTALHGIIKYRCDPQHNRTDGQKLLANLARGEQGVAISGNLIGGSETPYGPVNRSSTHPTTFCRWRRLMNMAATVSDGFVG